MITDIIHEIGSTLRNNKLRTALTGFAVSWGIFLLICLLGAGNGLMNSFMGNVDDYISQSVTVEGWYTSVPYNGYRANRRIQLDEKDVAYTEGRDWTGIIHSVTTTTDGRDDVLSLDSRTVNGYVMGVTPEYQEQEKLKMAAGRFINPNDIGQARKVIVIALSQAKELMPEDPEGIVGRWIGAGSVSFQVVGVYHTDERSWRRTSAFI